MNEMTSASTSLETASDKPLVALVHGPIVFTRAALNNEATPCIGLAYVAGYIRGKGYDCVIIDGVAEALNRVYFLDQYPDHACQGLTFDEIIAKIPPASKIIGFSAMFSGEWPVTRDLITAVKQAFPEAVLVAGGEHVTALSEYSLRDCPALDYIVRGEGEHTFYELLETIVEKGDILKVNGISFLGENGAYVENGGLPRIRDIDNIPWPYWPEGYLEKFWDAGKSYGVLTQRDMPMMISRGCPYRCTFCSNPQMWTTRYSLREIDDIIAEVKTYIERYNITAVQLYDLTAITKKGWAVEFGKRLLEENIHLKWSLPSGTRSEALDYDALKMLSEIGCNYLAYAPESGSLRTLERIKKRIDLKRLTESVMTSKKLGLVLRTNLMIGFPGEARKDVWQTIRYGMSLAWKGVDEVTLNLYSAYPGTELFNGLVSSGRITVNERYFLSLTSMYSDYSNLNHMTTNEIMSSRELSLYRVIFMFINYVIGYVRHPRRIFRTIYNILWGSETTTVLEHRLRDAVQRRRNRNEHQPASSSDNAPPSQ